MKEGERTNGETKMKSRKKAEVAVAVIPQEETHVVSQYSVIEERVAFQEALRAFEKWSEKNEAIRIAVEAGAVVERGLYRVDLVPTPTKLIIS
jgi:hypothetical protein